MPSEDHYLPYKNTKRFTKIVTDYLDASPQLQAFYQHPLNEEGILNAIKARMQFNTNRNLLVSVLQEQYSDLLLSEKQKINLEKLASPHTFTITTAHQPNIFAGPLYFIYKIFHAIQLANELNKKHSEYAFVPVFYMGSEDADLDELGNITVEGKRYQWQTNQTGAVGRMLVDKAFIALIDELYGQLGVLEFGGELIQLFKQAYTIGKTMKQACLELIQQLFGGYGLLVVIPDNAALKQSFIPVMEKELMSQFSHQKVTNTTVQLSKYYKAQAGGRAVNLFYLLDDKRERIEAVKDGFKVEALNLKWTATEMIEELHQHPERFSPNVILRGVFQETILPNIAFIGGGAEIAYWLELKSTFQELAIPYPLLLLRNSFLIMNTAQQNIWNKLGFALNDLFKTRDELMKELAVKHAATDILLDKKMEALQSIYNSLKPVAESIDTSLHQHIENIETKAIKHLKGLEQKLIRAEKKKYDIQQQQIEKLQSVLFPNNSLQERVENFSSFYARYGKQFLNKLYQASKGLQQEFCIIEFIENLSL